MRLAKCDIYNADFAMRVTLTRHIETAGPALGSAPKSLGTAIYVLILTTMVTNHQLPSHTVNLCFLLMFLIKILKTIVVNLQLFFNKILLYIKNG